MARNQRPRQTAEDKKNQQIGCGIILAALLVIGGCSALVSNDDDKSGSSSSSAYDDRPGQQLDDVESMKIPDYTGYQLQKAQDAAQSIGFFNLAESDLSSQDRVPVWDRGWQVCSQSPAGGETMTTDDLLTFEVVKNEESCDDPDGALEDVPGLSDNSDDEDLASTGGGIAGIGDDCNTTPDDPSAVNCDEGGSSSSSSGGSGSSSSSSSGGSGSSDQAPAGASAVCNDGSFSYSAHRRGTCSHHNGVKTWLKSLPS